MINQIGVIISSFIISIISGLIIIPLLRKFKIGQIERNDGPKSHLKKQGTPTMGGIIMIISIIIITFVVSIYSKKDTNIINIKNFLLIVFTSIGFGIVGFVDDFKKLVFKNTTGLKPAYKMLFLLIISIIYIVLLVLCDETANYTYLPLLKKSIYIPIFFYIPFAIFVLLGTTNAVNLTDGVDGLAASVTTLIIWSLTIASIKLGVTEVTTLGMTLIGACLGFLIFNKHPAKVFMGDTGSFLLGGAISSMALYLKMPLLLIIIAVIPIIETFSVMLQVGYYKLTKKRIFKMAPIHHHFELCGWKEEKVVFVFDMVTLILCVLGLLVV